MKRFRCDVPKCDFASDDDYRVQDHSRATGHIVTDYGRDLRLELTYLQNPLPPPPENNIPFEVQPIFKDYYQNYLRAIQALHNILEPYRRRLDEDKEKTLAEDRLRLVQKQVELDRVKQAYGENAKAAIENAVGETKTLLGKVTDARVEALTEQLRLGVERVETLQRELVEMKAAWEKETAERENRLHSLYR